jgi:SagB-type dehydrogenase family enzyme
MNRYEENRNFMKSNFHEQVESDQQKQLPQPPLQKPYSEKDELIELPKVDRSIITKNDIYDCIIDRVSHRKYKDESLKLEELSYLLYMTQGVKSIRGDNYATMRTVPSAGARHPYETYLAVDKVEGLKKGIYRYIPIEHKLVLVKEDEDISSHIVEGTLGQKFAGTGQVNFIWSAIPYRSEWRYVHKSHKVMLIDAGHICHALYLACESIGLGTCAIAAYDQKYMDSLIDVDGEDEFVVYMAPVGRVI